MYLCTYFKIKRPKEMNLVKNKSSKEDNVSPYIYDRYVPSYVRSARLARLACLSTLQYSRLFSACHFFSLSSGMQSEKFLPRQFTALEGRRYSLRLLLLHTTYYYNYYKSYSGDSSNQAASQAASILPRGKCPDKKKEREK